MGTGAAHTVSTGVGPIGVSVDVSADGRHLEDAAEVESLGYSAIWMAGGQIDRLGRIADLVRATRTATVVPGIIPTGVYPAADVAELYSDLERDHPGRFLVGLGGPQQPRSLAALGDYLNQLDRAAVPASRRILAALGPRKLDLARERFAGAVTLLTTPGSTAGTRATLGPDRTLAVGQMIALTEHPARARGVARELIGFLSRVPGYAASFHRMGFTELEVDTQADRLVDTLVVCGGPEQIAERISAHRRAGADHVYIGALGGDGLPGPLEVARTLAGPLFG